MLGRTTLLLLFRNVFLGAISPIKQSSKNEKFDFSSPNILSQPFQIRNQLSFPNFTMLDPKQFNPLSQTSTLTHVILHLPLRYASRVKLLPRENLSYNNPNICIFSCRPD